MAYKIRPVSKKQELKKPDEFVSTIDQITELARTRTQQLLTAIVSIVLIGVATAGYIWYRLYQEERASELEFQATTYYHQPAAPEGNEGETGAPSREESLKKAIELYQKVVSDYSRTDAAALSQYYLGNSYLELGDYANAISAYERFIKRSNGSAAMTALAYQRLGYAHLAKGDLQAALGSFESVVKMQGAQNKDQALFEIAKLHETQGQKEEAIQTYRAIVKDHPDSILATESKVRLKALGVAEAEPAPIPKAGDQPVAPSQGSSTKDTPEVPSTSD